MLRLEPAVGASRSGACSFSGSRHNAAGRGARVMLGLPSPVETEGCWRQTLLAAAVSEAGRFTHLQEVTAAGCDTEHVPEGRGQFPGQPSQVLRVRILVVEGV